MIAACEFDSDRHEYRWLGRVVPSVTQCLALIAPGELDGVEQETLEHAAWRGTEIHRAAGYLWEGMDCAESVRGTELEGYYSALVRFADDSGFRPLRWETPAIGELNGHRFGYTTDAVGRIGAKQVLLDLKTGVPSRKWGPQTAAYEQQERLRDGIERERIVVRLTHHGSYVLVPQRDQYDYTIWAAALAVEHFRRGK